MVKAYPAQALAKPPVIVPEYTPAAVTDVNVSVGVAVAPFAGVSEIVPALANVRVVRELPVQTKYPLLETLAKPAIVKYWPTSALDAPVTIFPV
jgi:hypothetical protein